MKISFYTLFAFLTALTIYAALPSRVDAAPPNPAPLSIAQPDGTTFQARVWGDEWSNGMETIEGYTVVLDKSSGYWVYAVRTSGGTLTPATTSKGELIAGRDDPSGLTKHTRPVAPNIMGGIPKRNTPPYGPYGYVRPNTGTQKVLVLLVAFADQGPVGTTPAYWRDKFFGSSGSVKSFYSEASYGKLNLAPAEETYGAANDGVVGWLTLPYNHPNTGGSTGDANRKIVRDAILAADPYVNFASFDTDRDGSLSSDELHIVVVVAGYEMSYGGSSTCSPSIWGHQWALGWGSVAAPVVDNTTVGSWYDDGGYTQFGEWHCRTSYEGRPGHAATIGVATHELGHDLGLPDLYDTDFSTNGVGNWDLMGTGVWNEHSAYVGDSPAQLDPWSKWYEGWLQPTRIIGSIAGQSIPQSESSASIFQLLDNPGGVDWMFNAYSGTGEYFLVENRQKVGFDAGLPGCGLLIWHIDESVTSTNSANANDWHRLVDLEQADGLFSLNKSAANWGDAGDPYPGSKGNHTFNGSSTPNSKLYNGNLSGVSVTTNSACGATMTANLSDGSAFVSPPANDDFANASEIAAMPYNAAVDVRGASTASDDPTLACISGKGAASVWYRFTPATNGLLQANTTGSDYDTVLAVWQGTRGSLSSVACNDNNGTAKTSSLSAYLIGGTAYFVEVAGHTAGGSLKLALSFTRKAPKAVTLLSPVQGTQTTGASQVLDWTDSPGATYYQVQVRKGSSTGALVDSAKPTISTYTTKVLPAALYYWRAAACNSVGCGWSGWWTFKLLVPARPTLQTPAHMSTTARDDVTLDWSDSPGATYYQVQVRKDTISGSSVAIPNPTVSTVTTPGLLSGHWYYWRVNACSLAGCSAWTSWWKFKVP